MKDQSDRIGLVLGVVFVSMGIAYDNSGVWMLGLVFLSLGLLARWKKWRDSR